MGSRWPKKNKNKKTGGSANGRRIPQWGGRCSVSAPHPFFYVHVVLKRPQSFISVNVGREALERLWPIFNDCFSTQGSSRATLEKKHWAGLHIQLICAKPNSPVFCFWRHSNKSKYTFCCFHSVSLNSAARSESRCRDSDVQRTWRTGSTFQDQHLSRCISCN